MSETEKAETEKTAQPKKKPIITPIAGRSTPPL